MIKYKFSLMLLALFSAAVVTSCSEDDDATGDSVLIVNDAIGTVTSNSPFITVNSNNAVNEGGVETVYEYTVTTSAPQPVDVYVNVSVVSGDAVEGEDFEFDHQVLIPAWSTSGMGSVTILADGDDEGTESFTIQIGSEMDANITVENSTITFDISDFGDLTIEFAWDRDIPGYPMTLCDIAYDMDIYVYNSEGEDVSDFQGATVNCPETIVLNLADLPNGEYSIMQNVYDDAGLAAAGITPAFEIPVTVTYSRDNSTFSGTFTQLPADVVDSDFGNDPTYDTQFIYVATLTVANGIYTFSQNGTTIDSGRIAGKQLKTVGRSKAAVPNRF